MLLDEPEPRTSEPVAPVMLPANRPVAVWLIVRATPGDRLIWLELKPVIVGPLAAAPDGAVVKLPPVALDRALATGKVTVVPLAW